MPSAESHPHVQALYQDHHGWLHNWLRNRTGCSHQAADLAQDTFLRVLTSRHRDYGSQPRAFLRRIAQNLVIDHWRRQEVERAWLEALSLMPEAEMPSPETQAIIVESLLRIDSALSSLPTQTRKIFELSQFDGLRQQEIAKRMDVSLNTVRRHLQKALAACILAD